jgi:hypothetical protein
MSQKSEELLKFITKQLVTYMGMPKEERRERQRRREHWTYRWFGMIPVSLRMLFGRTNPGAVNVEEEKDKLLTGMAETLAKADNSPQIAAEKEELLSGLAEMVAEENPGLASLAEQQGSVSGNSAAAQRKKASIAAQVEDALDEALTDAVEQTDADDWRELDFAAGNEQAGRQAR